MKLEDIVLRDGRKLLDVWPDAAENVKRNDVADFATIPAGCDGKVFVEFGSGDSHYVFLYEFDASGVADFVSGMGVVDE